MCCCSGCLNATDWQSKNQALYTATDRKWKYWHWSLLVQLSNSSTRLSIPFHYIGDALYHWLWPQIHFLRPLNNPVTKLNKLCLQPPHGMVTTNGDEQPGEHRASLLVEQWAKQTFAILGPTTLYEELSWKSIVNTRNGRARKWV